MFVLFTSLRKITLGQEPENTHTGGAVDVTARPPARPPTRRFLSTAQAEAPQLYPPMDLPGPLRIMEEDVSLVAKQRELAADMAKSPYYITPKYAVKDVERYSDRQQESEKQCQSLGRYLSADLKAHLPPELLDRPSRTGAGAGASLAGVASLPAFDGKSLTFLEDRERRSAENKGDKDKDKEKDKDDAGMMSDVEGEMEEEELDDDYAVDHYESAPDSMADDDEPAAVF